MDAGMRNASSSSPPSSSIHLSIHPSISIHSTTTRSTPPSSHQGRTRLVPIPDLYKRMKQVEIRSIVPDLEDLAKEIQVKKIRLKEMKRQKSKLSAEVKFLRRKLKHFLRQNKNQSARILRKNKFSGKGRSASMVVPDLNQMSIPSGDDEDCQRMKKQYPLDTDPTVCRDVGIGTKKRKISRQDQVSLMRV